jgi:hypothetical protein
MTLAPRECSGGDPPEPTAAGIAAAPLPARIATETISTPPRHVPSPAPRARPRSGAQQGDSTSPRNASPTTPGESIRARFLLDFHTTVVPGEIAPSSPVPIWVTPHPFVSPFDPTSVQFMLNFLLTARPGRLVVTRVRSRVFKVWVSCRNVANALLIRSPLCMGDSKLWLHPSMAAAERAVGGSLKLLTTYPGRQSSMRQLFPTRVCACPALVAPDILLQLIQNERSLWIRLGLSVTVLRLLPRQPMRVTRSRAQLPGVCQAPLHSMLLNNPARHTSRRSSHLQNHQKPSTAAPLPSLPPPAVTSLVLT